MSFINIEIVLHPVGLIQTQISDEKIKLDHRNVSATVEIFPEFSKALKGLEGYSHLFIFSLPKQVQT